MNDRKQEFLVCLNNRAQTLSKHIYAQCSIFTENGKNSTIIISDAFISTCLQIKILFCINKELSANRGVPFSIQYEKTFAFLLYAISKLSTWRQKLLVKSIRAISTVFPHGMAKYKQPFFMLFWAPTSPCLPLLILCILHRQYHYLMEKMAD